MEISHDTHKFVGNENPNQVIPIDITFVINKEELKKVTDAIIRILKPLIKEIVIKQVSSVTPQLLYNLLNLDDLIEGKINDGLHEAKTRLLNSRDNQMLMNLINEIVNNTVIEVSKSANNDSTDYHIVVADKKIRYTV
jgi:hypothetical protein